MRKFISASIIFVVAVSIAYATKRREMRYFRTPALEKNFMSKLEYIEKQIDELTKRVEKLEIKFEPKLKLKHEGKAKRIRGPLEIGQIVYFDGDDKLMIQQIIDERSILAELRIRQLRGNTWVAIQEPVFITGVSTNGLVDDKVIKFPSDMLFQITDTKTYETVIGGTRTVFALERL